LTKVRPRSEDERGLFSWSRVLGGLQMFAGIDRVFTFWAIFHS
jgi:hypothetical protein